MKQCLVDDRDDAARAADVSAGDDAIGHAPEHEQSADGYKVDQIVESREQGDDRCTMHHMSHVFRNIDFEVFVFFKVTRTTLRASNTSNFVPQIKSRDIDKGREWPSVAQSAS
jgi:hypothetical protein